MASGSNNAGGIRRPAEPRLTEGAQLLARGRPLEALERVALLDEPKALALRGIALAQLGDLDQARTLLRRATERFIDDPLSRARTVAAEAEIAIARRDLEQSVEGLSEAAETLRNHGDHGNAAYAELVLARRHLLLGELDRVERRLEDLAFVQVPATVAAVAHLVSAEVAERRLRASAAARVLDVAANAARRSGVVALEAEVARARERLEMVAARVVDERGTRSLCLVDVEQLLGSERLVVDGCRRRLRRGDREVSLLQRPVQMDLLMELAMAGRRGAPREELIGRVFGARRPNESHRARLRVDIGRLRKAIAGFASPKATRDGYVLEVPSGEHVPVLLPPIDGPHAEVVALLADGEPWSAAALALATGASRRTMQRALKALGDEGRVTAIGRGPKRRWVSPPLTRIATAMLLPPAGHAG